jgi:hypothetical protein
MKIPISEKNDLDIKRKSVVDKWDRAISELLNDYNSIMIINSTSNSEAKESLFKDIEALSTKLKIVKDDREVYRKELFDSVKRKYDDKNAELVNNYRLATEELNDALSKKKEGLIALTRESDKVEKVNILVKTTETELSSKQLMLDKMRKSYNENRIRYERNISGVLDEITSNDVLLKTLRDQFVERTQKINILQFWKKAFSDTGIKAILLDETVPILNKRALELSELTDTLRVTFDSQTTLKSGKQRNKFSIRAIQTQNLSELSELSAGESRLTNIIVLLSLRHLMETMNDSKLNVLLLDEILDSLDPDNISVALDMIKCLSKEKCVVLISHTLRDNIEADEFLSM